MAKKRSDAEQQIADLLHTARKSLRLSVAFLSRLDGTTQHLEVVDTSVPFLFQEGYQQKQEVTLCQAILDRKLPAGHPRPQGLPRGDEAAGRPHAAAAQLRLGAGDPERRLALRHLLRGRADRRTRT